MEKIVPKKCNFWPILPPWCPMRVFVRSQTKPQWVLSSEVLNHTQKIKTKNLNIAHQMPPYLTQELHSMKHVSCGISSARQYLWRRPNKKKEKVKWKKSALSFVFRFELLRLSLTWRWDGPLYLACSAGVFFGRANVNPNPNPLPALLLSPSHLP